MGLAKLYKRGGLTKPQWELLCQFVDDERRSAGREYRPAKALLDLGYLELREGRFGDYVGLSVNGRRLVENVRRLGNDE